MFAASPVSTFAAKLSVGTVPCGLFLLIPANANSAGHEFETIGCAAKRIVDRLKERAGEQSREAGGPPPLASNEAQRVGGRARRSSS